MGTIYYIYQRWWLAHDSLSSFPNTGSLVCPLKDSATTTFSQEVWHSPVGKKKGFTSLCKWQRGRGCQGWGRGKVWQPKEKRGREKKKTKKNRSYNAVTTLHWLAADLQYKTNRQLLHLANTGVSHKQKRRTNYVCQQASHTGASLPNT